MVILPTVIVSERSAAPKSRISSVALLAATETDEGENEPSKHIEADASVRSMSGLLRPRVSYSALEHPRQGRLGGTG